MNTLDCFNGGTVDGFTGPPHQPSRMACLLCGSRTTTRRIVDLDDGSVHAEVCRSCAEEYLLLDTGSPTCEFCTELADYSLAKLREANDVSPPIDVESDLEVIEEHVICHEHLSDLLADAPQPS